MALYHQPYAVSDDLVRLLVSLILRTLHLSLSRPQPTELATYIDVRFRARQWR